MKNINTELQNVSRLLKKKRLFMFSFMERYLFSQIHVQRTEIIKNLENFLSMTDFCLKTRQRIVRDQFKEGKTYFSDNFREIQKCIQKGSMEELRNLVYSCPGVGQKIGSLILEVTIHYGEANRELEPQLFVPIDTHVQRILRDCLGLEGVPGINASPSSPKYRRFQEYLANSTAGGLPRVYFDYLWFVGKVFCTKTDASEKVYSRGYRLCPMCWIKKYCILSDKWIAV